jgi:hypothetical protein
VTSATERLSCDIAIDWRFEMATGSRALAGYGVIQTCVMIVRPPHRSPLEGYEAANA